ncbi:MAG: tripartite tricarboxylate transporter substrate binding protein [Variovorax sp.]
MPRFQHLFVGAAVVITAVAGNFANAQTASYPTKAIRWVVPIPPGGAPDVVARLIGAKFSEQIGQPVVVDNRTGANGNIAADLVAKADPDGYTLLIGQDSLITVNPHLYAKMPFDALKDLVPVASLASNEFVLSVNPSVPAKTFKEFIDYARKADPPLNFASGGNGSQHQLAMEMLMQRADIKLTHIPYRGGTPATVATVAGDTQVMFAGSSTAPQIAAGKLRALAVTGATHSKNFPDLPPIADIYPGYEVSIWIGLFAPAGTPDAVLQKLRAEIKVALASPELQAKLSKAGGLSAMSTTPEAFKALIQSDYYKYGKLVRDVGIKLE